MLIACVALCLSLIALMDADSSASTNVDVRIINGTGAICKSGAISLSSGRGTCSQHGGVEEWLVDD